MLSRVHINFTVSDVDAAVDFYSRLFGAEPSKRKPDYANFRLAAPALHLALPVLGIGFCYTVFFALLRGAPLDNP